MALNINRKSFILFILFVLSIISLAFLVFNIPWFVFTSLQKHLDTYTYQAMLDSGMYKSILNSDLNVIGIITTEPAWSTLVVWLNNFFSSTDIFFFLIPFFIMMVYGFYIYRNSNFLNIFFLIHPIALMFYLAQLRLAFAVSIFLLLTLIIDSKKNLYFFSFFIFLIHSSFLIFWTFFLIIDVIVNSKKDYTLKILFLLLSGLLLCFLTGPLISIVLGALGDRRADTYTEGIWQTSFATSAYCIMFIAVICMNFYFNRQKYITFEQGCSLVFFSMVAFSPFLVGGYPFRFLSAIFPIMVVSLFQLEKGYRLAAVQLLIFIGIYIGFTQLNWIELVV